MNKSLIIACMMLAIVLLACILPMPYGFYVIVRFATMIVMVCLAYTFYQSKQTNLAVVAGAMAILFQPFAKIALGRDMWNIVDVVVAIGLIILVFKNRNSLK